MRLLLVEDAAQDDAMMGDVALQLLTGQHGTVDWLRDSAMAGQALHIAQYDLVVLDLGLPERDRLDVLRALRNRRSLVGVRLNPAMYEHVNTSSGLTAPVTASRR